DITAINANLSHDSGNHTGFTGGIEGGYNYVSGNWLFGIEADWVLLSTKSRETRTYTSLISQPIIPPPPPTTYSFTQKADTNWMVSLRPRIGIISGPWLFYGTGGVAWADVKARIEYSDTRSGADAFTVEKHTTHPGW